MYIFYEAVILQSLPCFTTADHILHSLYCGRYDEAQSSELWCKITKTIKEWMLNALSYRPASRSKMSHTPKWLQMLIHFPSVMHLHGGNYFCKRKKKNSLLSKVGKWMRVRLYRNFAWHSIRKAEEKQPSSFLSVPRSIKLPLRGGKQQTRLFLFTPRGKYLTSRLSLKGQTTRNLAETQDTHFLCHTGLCPAIISLTITFPRLGGGIWAPEVLRMSGQRFDLLIVVNIDGRLTLCWCQKGNLCLFTFTVPFHSVTALLCVLTDTM